MVIFVDRTTYSAKAVMTVGQNVRQGELLHARSSCSLNDTNKGDIMRGHLVKLDLQILVIAGNVVAGQNAISHGTLLSCFLVRSAAGLCGNSLCNITSVFYEFDTIDEVCTILVQFHWFYPPSTCHLFDDTRYFYYLIKLRGSQAIHSGFRYIYLVYFDIFFI